MSYKENARDAALRKLTARARTEKEICDYLSDREFSTEEIKDAVDFLKEYDYLNDERYCRQYYIYSRKKGKAMYRIVRELEKKGISASISKSAIEDMENEEEYKEQVIDDRLAAMDVGLKMARIQREDNKEIDQKFLARVGRRLMGLGYDSGTCYYVMEKIKDYGKENE